MDHQLLLDIACAPANGGGNRDHRLERMVKSGGIDVVPARLRNNTICFPWPDPG